MLRPKHKATTTSQSSNELTAQAICGDPQTTPTATDSNVSATIRLAELSLTDFIKCQCYEDYSPVKGDKNAWMRLLSEYYIAKQDHYASRYLELIVTMERLRHRAEWVDFMASTLLTLYNEKLAEVLREVFPRFKFTYESHKDDLQGVANGEKGNKILFDAAYKEFEEMERQKGSDGPATPQEKERAIFKSVIGINAAMQSSYNVDTLNALTYALLLHEVDRLIEKQNNKDNNG